MIFKQDPQSNVSLFINEGICEATFLLWDSNDNEVADYNGKLVFNDCWAAEFSCLEVSPYSLTSDQCIPGIFLTQLSDAEWYANKVRDKVTLYPDWQIWDKRAYIHYLLMGRDNYVQIIASGFKFEIIPFERRVIAK